MGELILIYDRIQQTSATLPGDDDDLVAATFHCAIGLVGDGIDVRRKLVQIASRVLPDLLRGVDAQLLVRIHRQHNVADVRLGRRDLRNKTGTE